MQSNLLNQDKSYRLLKSAQEIKIYNIFSEKVENILTIEAYTKSNMIDVIFKINFNL